jgi:sugar phosphate isomerase/epimerase
VPAIIPALEQTKLKRVSVHVAYDIYSSDAELNTVLGNVKKWGFEYLVPPSMKPAEKNSLEAFRPEIAKLKKAAAQARTMGLKMCYHNHAFEFQPLSGTTPLDLLIEQTDPATLQLETDVFWVSVAGHNPAEFIKKHAGRVALLHLKDMKKGLTPRFNQNVPKDTFLEVGSGSIDFKAVLRAATDAGVKHFFVEQDETARNPLSSMEMSYKYLHALKF